MNPLADALNSHPAPLYSQIRESLRARILDGTYKPHDRIPSEKEFMEGFGVSRITVRQALNDLEKEGVIFKIPGKGSYVSKPKPVQDLTRLQGFGEAMARLGFETRNKVVGLATVPAAEDVAQRLQVLRGTPVVEIRRIRSVDGAPISFDVTYVPEAIGQRLAKEDLVTRDIFLIMENDYGIPLGYADLAIDAVSASGELTSYLGVAQGAPLLHIERLACAKDGTPVEFDYVYYRGDTFRYQLRLERA